MSHFFLCLNKVTDADADTEEKEKLGVEYDISDLSYLEQKSVLLALRSSVTPSLTGADAVMFATLLSDFFPSHDVPLIFDQECPENNEPDATIGLALHEEKGAPLRLLPGSPQPKDQGSIKLYT